MGEHSPRPLAANTVVSPSTVTAARPVAKGKSGKAPRPQKSPARPAVAATARSRFRRAARSFVSAPGHWRPWLKWSVVVCLALLVLPMVEVGCVRFVNPLGTPLMALRTMEARLAGHPPAPVRYHWARWRELPDTFLRGVWAAEDARFFKHHGFDWIEFHTAMAQAEKTGRPPRGTSTITMQCARSLFLWQGRSYVRKALEAYYTVWMETFLSKRRILELYANTIELGDGVYGVPAAGEAWFHQPTAQALSAEQCIALAALPGAPRRWNPHAPSHRYRKRQERIARDLPLMHWPAGVR